MKHRFLLDENIIHHAIKGVDKNDNKHLTCTTLVLQIARNCHRIIVNDFLGKRYNIHLRNIKSNSARVLLPTFVLSELVYNAQKLVHEGEEPPALPSNCNIPTEDINVVRAALISHPKLVTADVDLMTAVNGCEALHLQAISPAEAIILASDT